MLATVILVRYLAARSSRSKIRRILASMCDSTALRCFEIKLREGKQGDGISALRMFDNIVQFIQ
jgi:hypothetical protein